MGCDNRMSRNREKYWEMKGESDETIIFIRQCEDWTYIVPNAWLVVDCAHAL